jgi:latrophilin 2
MNEAFNLYITITYAAHQISPINDTGPQWRFYIIGWLFPGLIVIILLLTKSHFYYDKKLCMFNLENLWINVSPMIAMLAVKFEHIFLHNRFLLIDLNLDFY